MFVADEPLAINAFVAVGDADGEFGTLAGSIGGGYVLDAVRVSDAASAGGDFEVGDGGFDGALDSGKEVLKIFAIGGGADVLAGRGGIENHETVVGNVAGHDGVDVFCAEGGYETVFESLDLRLIAG